MISCGTVYYDAQRGSNFEPMVEILKCGAFDFQGGFIITK